MWLRTDEGARVVTAIRVSHPQLTSFGDDGTGLT